jgi:hypothetical protein
MNNRRQPPSYQKDSIRIIFWPCSQTKPRRKPGFSSSWFAINSALRASVFRYETPDRFQGTMINGILRFATGLQLAFRDLQGMVTAFDNV